LKIQQQLEECHEECCLNPHVGQRWPTIASEQKSTFAKRALVHALVLGGETRAHGDGHSFEQVVDGVAH